MIYVSATPQRLVGRIVVVCTYAIEGKDRFPEDMTFDEGFESIDKSIEHLQSKLTSARSDQLISMSAQAKRHFEAGESKLGAWLMQDMERVIKRESPFAYPEHLYRWPRQSASND